jgi:hypothetical protein
VAGKENHEKTCIMLRELKRFVDFEGTWVEDKEEGGLTFVRLGIIPGEWIERKMSKKRS